MPVTPYLSVEPEELHRRIEAVRERFGDQLCILGHHYQRDEVLQHADLRGDSFKLSRQAAENAQCEAIVFCGVHFMAETADILANRPEQVRKRGKAGRIPVILPELTAGCPMADMAEIGQVEACWEQLGEHVDLDEITPVTYVNSSAVIKAFCGRHGGIVCTSANAAKILKWAFDRRPRVVFFPDQHLARNTALEMGITPEEMPMWDPAKPDLGGNTPEQLEKGRVFLWRGHCDVHQKFLPEHVRALREKYPDIKVIVHPECPRETVELADISGSTGRILSEVENTPAGTRWAIGTEWHMVHRLQETHPEQDIHFLAPEPSICETMSLIDLPHLAWALESLAEGRPVNDIEVDATIAADALKSLQRMLEAS